jgi:hypothetical protein
MTQGLYLSLDERLGSGHEMEIYHPLRKEIKYRVECKVKDDISDIALLELKDALLVPPKKELQGTPAIVSLGEELSAAGFPIKFPEGTLSIARASVDGFYKRSDHAIWKGDRTVRYLIARGIPDGVSGGPVVNGAGFVVGVGAKGPGEDDHLTPSEVIPLAALHEMLESAKVSGA